jgi:hypothetical protein
MSEDSACKSEVFKFPVSRPDDRAILSGIPSVNRSSRLDDVPYRPDPILYQEASVPACIRLDVSVARLDDL